MPGLESLPSTLRRSSDEAQRTWVEAHDSAVETYGEGGRAHRVAYSALKHKFEKVGDHWERKEGTGPSDAHAEEPTRHGRPSRKPTRSGVDANASKHHLYEIAAKLRIHGRSKMNKPELVHAIEKANARDTRAHRDS